MEDFDGEDLETVEVGVFGKLRGCRCLDAKEWKGFVGVVGNVCPTTGLRLELAVDSPGEGVIFLVPFRGVTTCFGSLDGDGFVFLPLEEPVKTHC